MNRLVASRDPGRALHQGREAAEAEEEEEEEEEGEGGGEDRGIRERQRQSPGESENSIPEDWSGIYH